MLVKSFGWAMSEMSKIRMPRTRFSLTASGTPPNWQSCRLLVDSEDMNSRFLYTDTSFCDAGHVYALISAGFAGFEMSQISKPL